MTSGAYLSADRVYRYRLWRDTGVPIPPSRLESWCLFVMLNPSTADETKDDPTIRRCVGYAKTWGYTRVNIANLFAFRATDPKALLPAPDPVGPENDTHLAEMADASALVVCAWGTHGGLHGRDQAVLRLLRHHSLDGPRCLGRTKAGHPKHPLYLKNGIHHEAMT